MSDNKKIEDMLGTIEQMSVLEASEFHCANKNILSYYTVFEFSDRNFREN